MSECPKCRGTGYIDYESAGRVESVSCPDCSGTGDPFILMDRCGEEPDKSCRYVFGPEIKSQAAQAVPALPRKAHVSQEAEECKVGAAPSEIPLKEWLAVQDAYKEAYEKSRTPSKEWTYRGSLVSADFILCRFGKTVAVVPDAAVVRELVDSLNNLQSLQAQLDAVKAEITRLKTEGEKQ